MSMKIAIACSAGGHLTEILQLEDAYAKFPHFYFTFLREDSKELDNVHFVTDPKRNPVKLLKNVFQSLRVFLKERPDVILTTGAGVVVPFCLLGRMFGKRVVYVESFCRIEEPSLTGKIMYHLASVFLVQWEELLEKYGKKAQMWGRLA